MSGILKRKALSFCIKTRHIFLYNTLLTDNIFKLIYLRYLCIILWFPSQVALVGNNLPVNAGDVRQGSILESRRSPGGGHSNPLQYSCLENPMDRGAWQATVHGVTQSRTWLKRLSTHLSNWFFLNNQVSTFPNSNE